jgi:hypothetical protein
VALGICAIAALIVYDRKLGFLAWPFVAAAIILGLWAWRLYQADGAEHSLLRAILASILLSIGLFGIVMPLMESAFPSAAVSRILKGADCKSPLLAAAGFDEPSLVFMAGTETILSNGADAADFLRGGTCRFAAIEVKHERAFLRRAQQTGLRYAPPKRFNGFNYASGRAVSISVYQSDE